jgi:hypothetical protein
VKEEGAAGCEFDRGSRRPGSEKLNKLKEGKVMDVGTIRVLSGIGAVLLLFVIIWRRKRKATEE